MYDYKKEIEIWKNVTQFKNWDDGGEKPIHQDIWDKISEFCDELQKYCNIYFIYPGKSSEPSEIYVRIKIKNGYIEFEFDDGKLHSYRGFTSTDSYFGNDISSWQEAIEIIKENI